ncbi:hypothetical protein HELRODRAFT_159395 [Helobdella robusta]|uniref:PH domain-containing protein n=1 Tax=Helobdella robusta TaxID=6412 RepID=T1ENZ9_HELRO|nr:hypothetical protein HELRODRAFT_159395 [Helobdella robusta]ESO12810.1 hypothetical protein HELRODRAFT_159395 [Helobdella robusta]
MKQIYKKWKQRYFVLTYIAPLQSHTLKNEKHKNKKDKNHQNNNFSDAASSVVSMNPTKSADMDFNNNQPNNNLSSYDLLTHKNKKNTLNLNFNSSSSYELNDGTQNIGRAYSVGNVNKISGKSEITNHRAELTYYADELMTKKLGSVDLENCEEVLSHLKSNTFRYIFAIKTYFKKTRPRTYFLVASTEEDMIAWVGHLCKCLQMVNDGNFSSTYKSPVNKITNFYNSIGLLNSSSSSNNHGCSNISNNNTNNDSNSASTATTCTTNFSSSSSSHRTSSVKQMFQRQISTLSNSRSRSVSNSLDSRFLPNNNNNNITNNVNNNSNNSTPTSSVSDMLSYRDDTNAASPNLQWKLNHLKHLNNTHQQQMQHFYQQQQQQHMIQQQLSHNMDNMMTFYNYPNPYLHNHGGYDNISSLPHQKPPNNYGPMIPPPPPNFQAFLPFLIPQQHLMNPPTHQSQDHLYNIPNKNQSFKNNTAQMPYDANVYKVPNQGYYDAPNSRNFILPKSRLQYDTDQKLAPPKDKNAIYSAQFARNVVQLVSNMHQQSARPSLAQNKYRNFENCPSKQSEAAYIQYDIPKSLPEEYSTMSQNLSSLAPEYDTPNMNVNLSYVPETPYNVPQHPSLSINSDEIPSKLTEMGNQLGRIDLNIDHPGPQFYTSLPERSEEFIEMVQREEPIIETESD